ncbi:hypothetical protein JWS13_30985 [Rhodococcus pseudokoreensis]|uniref:Enoyl-(Acyl carrier protein) reductase n=1 Tax=Rhodococcus pseudokoreensis TaxID=2811421 RepID=A0A974W7U3_9NOCA|nr:hypothetical protein [Rhodococcus pseudokoreensis]QSE92719.1 hypothetical protein JWS13_30985 [Rhodococcus pseudokoreensis]
MINNDATYSMFFPQAENLSQEEVATGFIHMNGLRVPWVEPIDVSNAVLYRVSDDARYVTGTTHVLDAGGSAPYRIPHSEEAPDVEACVSVRQARGAYTQSGTITARPNTSPRERRS